ncbi:MAG: hypothetical protein ACK4RN_07200 [Pseudorhodobacter sp.]
MSRDSQAQVFIKTLAEMLEDHREKRSLRLRHQFKAHAERFIQTFRTGLDGDLRPSAGALERRQTDRDMIGSRRDH